MSGRFGKRRIALAIAAPVLTAILVLAWAGYTRGTGPWGERERALIDALWLGHLAALPPDPTNAVADDPRAAELGHRLFFDPRLSANGGVSCATCHRPERRFADTFPQSVGIGPTHRNTPSLVGSAWSPWQYWDGRKDSQWSQALAPLEHPGEQGAGRHAVADVLGNDRWYRERYASLFGTAPGREPVDRVFVNVGKALAAYERKLRPGPTRFDTYAQALRKGVAFGALLTADELAGLRLFIGKARCIDCHNGPLFTNNAFHNTGQLSAPGELPDRGRFDGVNEIRGDPFNCMGEFSDAGPEACGELRFVQDGPETLGAMRTPSLRNLGGTAPYGHHGRIPDLSAVLAHYNEAPEAMIGHNETKPLGLSRQELRQLEAFLGSLDAPPAIEEQWLEDPFNVLKTEK